MEFIVVFGGESWEHEISIVSAITLKKELKNIAHFVFIDSENDAYLIPHESMKSTHFSSLAYKKDAKLTFTKGGFLQRGFLKKNILRGIVINLIHGKSGEDGQMAGLLDFYQIPFVGPRIEACAMSFSKEMTKIYAEARGVRVLEYKVVDSALAQNLNQNNSVRSTQTRPLRGAKNREQGCSSATADFLLEAEKRGSPPKSEKRQLLARRGSGAGGAALLRKESSENNGEGFAESRLDSAVDCHESANADSRNDIIVAFAALQILSLTLAEVRSLIVDENYRRKGLATMLIEHLITEARALNIKEILALTYQREVFEKLGFKEIAKESLPNQKIWADCIKCKKFPVCDEIALTKIL